MAGKHRSASGAGSIRKKTVTRNGKTYTYWEGRVTIGRDPGSGKQIQKSYTGKTQKEVREKMQAAAVALTEGTYQEPSRMRFGHWLDIWAAEYLGGVKISTKDTYTIIIRKHLKPAMGSVKLQEITPHQIQAFINSLNDYAPNTIHNIFLVLHYALEKAVELDYLNKNPASRCELPRLEQRIIHPLDTPAFLKGVEGDAFELLYKIDLFTGMRQGEIMGLKWDCVDFQKGTIQIVRQLKYHKGGYYFTTPKNGKDRKIMPAPRVMGFLREQERRQAEDRMRAGELWENSGLVFTDEAGGFLKVHTVYKHFKRIVEKIGCPEARFHDIRHTYAVNALRAGDDIKTVQETLGHASAAFTLAVYGHVTEQMRYDSATRMENFMKTVLGV